MNAEIRESITRAVDTCLSAIGHVGRILNDIGEPRIAELYASRNGRMVRTRAREVLDALGVPATLPIHVDSRGSAEELRSLVITSGRLDEAVARSLLRQLHDATSELDGCIAVIRESFAAADARPWIYPLGYMMAYIIADIKGSLFLRFPNLMPPELHDPTEK